MRGRAWVALCLLVWFIGSIAGWSARAATADHRYIRALAERHEAIANYYLTQSDQLIRDNAGDIAKGRKNYGSKKN